MSPNLAIRRSGRRRAKQIIQMLLDGELDAVLGEKVGTSRPQAAVCRRRRGGESLVRQARVMPINHMVVVSQTLSDKHPEAVREVHRLLAGVRPMLRRRHRGSAPMKCAARWK